MVGGVPFVSPATPRLATVTTESDNRPSGTKGWQGQLLSSTTIFLYLLATRLCHRTSHNLGAYTGDHYAGQSYSQHHACSGVLRCSRGLLIYYPHWRPNWGG
ncbi:hypothetical protein E2562_035248 [Oryza meyeriana var. granulata]|uniref:Uncharacterized protein n=1 Tax=Oryza meyeriana var. granulata TaxID=110450 RepID=A0A6G1CL63_9ORYZ|nr:hypothetical protein E2562_035248 [Oryza meyeriana var. granulata]